MNSNNDSKTHHPGRRKFIGTLATASAFTIVPRHVLGGTDKPAPSDKLNIAAVGVGGMGRSNLKNMETENIVALCDVDWDYAAKTFVKYPDARQYKDFRVMLDKEKEIDAVLVATPDHTHAIVSMAAMQLGKHVYTQKPLTYSVAEARALANMAKRTQVVTQMGNQGHSGEAIRMLCEWIWDGAIGPVHEVHVWTNRPVWPQNIATRPPAMPVPKNMDWDLWIGPAPMRDFNSYYHPHDWRGWKDFGTGALGDIGCHSIDYPYTALKLDYPTSVNASLAYNIDPSDDWKKEKNEETYPSASMVTYYFPARGEMPPVKLMWYDGGLMPSRPLELEAGRPMPENGMLFIGEKGIIMNGGGSTRLIPETAMKSYSPPEKTLPRCEVSHEQNWIECCKKRKTANSHFLYAGPLAETVLLGNIALLFPGDGLEFDPKSMEIKNNTQATAFLQREYRQGWFLT